MRRERGMRGYTAINWTCLAKSSVGLSVIPYVSRKALACYIADFPLLAFYEGEQLVVDPVLEGRAHTVWRTFVDHEFGILDDFRGLHRGGADGDDLIIVTMQDERRHVEFLQ